jgi:hypothetical protein
MNAKAALIRKPSELPPGFGVRWLVGNGADTAFGRVGAPEAKAECALTPHPAHSKTLARPPWHVLLCDGDTTGRSARTLRIHDTADWKSALRLAALRTRGTSLVASVALLACYCVAASAAELRIGQALVPLGGTVSVPVTWAGASSAVGAQFDVSFDPSSVTLLSISADPALAGHLVDRQQLGPGCWRGLVYSLTNGPISSGTVWWLNFNVAANAPDGVVPLVMSNAIVAQVAGQRVAPLAQVSGALTVSSAENFVPVALAGTGQLRMTISGLAGRVFTLQGSPDLFHWADLHSYTNQDGTLTVTNAMPVGRTTYFYRTVFRPPAAPYPYPAPNLSGLSMLTNSGTTFQLNSTAGSAWRIQGSPDLVYWGNYGLVTNQTGTLQVTNRPYLKPPLYFYRATQP